MKKLLISTTALVAVAGIAHAEVTLTGTAEAGITQGTNKDDALGYHTDMDVNFRGVGTTDSGFQFGATIDLDEVSNGISDKELSCFCLHLFKWLRHIDNG